VKFCVKTGISGVSGSVRPPLPGETIEVGFNFFRLQII
jgi:hypothetical protein